MAINLTEQIYKNYQQESKKNTLLGCCYDFSTRIVIAAQLFVHRVPRNSSGICDFSL